MKRKGVRLTALALSAVCLLSLAGCGREDAMRADIDPDTPASEVSRVQRTRFCALLKGVPLHVQKMRPIEEAIITRGGIHVRQVNASNMESKIVPGLFFAGEILDVDGYTGGYNLQIAFSTGALAGRGK